MAKKQNKDLHGFFGIQLSLKAQLRLIVVFNSLRQFKPV